MCRLCAVTMTADSLTKFDRDLKITLVHELMLRTCEQEAGQRDGWGVTDGHNTWKSASPYLESAPIWMPKISPEGFIISHLRKASTTTHRTVAENHPYVFDINGRPLYAAHNGWIDGTKWVNSQQGQPQTDSWRALTDLAELMRNNTPDTLDADLMDQWLSTYTQSSVYAFLFLWNDSLYTVRGSARPLHLLPAGDGFLIHTSDTALKTMQEYLHQLYDIPTEPIFKLPDNHITRYTLGSTDVYSEKISPNHVQTYASWRTLPPVQKNDQAASVDERDDAGSTNVPVEYYSAPVTSPRNKTTATGTSLAVSVNDLQRRRERWTEVARTLAPMRASLSRLWAAHILGYTDSVTDDVDPHFLRHCTEEDLRLLHAMLRPVYTNGKSGSIFTPAANIMLNWWNHIVKPGWDIDVHLAVFGLDFFWLDQRYTAVRDESELYTRVNEWKIETLKLFEERLPHSKMDTLLDLRKLEAAKNTEVVVL